LAIVAGAAFAASLSSAQWLAAALRLFGPDSVFQSFPGTVFIVFLRGLVSWIFGIVMIGGPAWWLLHRHGFRGWRTAVLAGMALTAIAVLVLAIPLPGQSEGLPSSTNADRPPVNGTIVRYQITQLGWEMIGLRAALTAFVGGAVGGLMWRVAYRRS
jgi:hypothetical protein